MVSCGDTQSLECLLKLVFYTQWMVNCRCIFIYISAINWRSRWPTITNAMHY